MTTDNASQQKPQPSVGERLRLAREATGLTVAEVADRQHLRPAVIKAIENGDYRQIDSELFLKGYVRIYAGQVGLDADSVIRQLDRELEPLREEQKARVEANPLISIARRKRRKRQIARVVGVLILVAATFYGVSLYLARQQAAETEAPADPSQGLSGELESPVTGSPESGSPVTEAPASESATEGPVSENGAETTLPENPATESRALQLPASESSAGPDNGEAADDADAGTPPAVSGNGQTLAPAPEPRAGDDTGPGSESAANAPGGEETSPIQSQPLEESPALASSQQGVLKIGFSGDCWVEVQDRSGRTLEASLRSAGDTLELNGQAPLRVVLGAVSAVESLSYSGEPVDLSGRRVSNNRLVLTLP